MKKAFTMIELVFVIVVLGILSSIAISKMAVTRDDALVVKGKSQVAAIRSSITLVRSMNMMRGLTNGGNPTKLDAFTGASNIADATKINLFDYDSNSSDSTKKLLDYPIRAVAADKSGWRKTANNKYTFRVTNVDVNFEYKADGSFDCHVASNTTAAAKKLCNTLTQ